MYEIELQIASSNQGSFYRYYSTWLGRSRVRVGQTLKDHVLLLSRKIPRECGFLDRNGADLFWTDPGGVRHALVLGQWIWLGRNLRLRVHKIRIWVWGLVLSHLLFGFLRFDAKTLSSTEAGPIAPSSKTLLRSIELPARGVFSAEKLVFVLHTSEKVAGAFHYTPGNVSRDDQVSIRLNGELLAYVPSMPGRWAMEERLVVKKESMRRELNEVVFEGKNLGNQEKSWAIRDVYFRPDKTTEGSGARQPDEVFQAAERAFLTRQAKAGNLQRAKVLLQKANRLWRAGGKHIPARSIQLKRRIDETMTKMIANRHSEAEGAMARGQKKKAAKIYEALLKEFIDSSDPQRRDIYESLQEAKK